MIHNSQDTISQVLSRKPKHVLMQQCVMIMLVSIQLLKGKLTVTFSHYKLSHIQDQW